MDSTIFSLTFDFYTEVLEYRSQSMSDALVDVAWELLKTELREDEYKRYDELAGDRYLTKIELDGPDIRVTIYDDDIEHSNALALAHNRGAKIDAYIKCGGSACINCGSIDIEGNGPYEADGDWIASPVCCRSCGATWDDIHSLTGVSDVQIDKGTE